MVGPVAWQFLCWGPQEGSGSGSTVCLRRGLRAPVAARWPPVCGLSGSVLSASPHRCCTHRIGLCVCGACFCIDVYSRFTCWFRFLTPETCLSDPSQLWLGHNRGSFGRTCLNSMQPASPAASSDFLLPLEEVALHSFEKTYFLQPF